MKMTTSYKHVGPLSHFSHLGPLRPLAVATLALLVSGCVVGPDYHRPQVNVPATYAELPGWTSKRWLKYGLHAPACSRPSA